MFCWRETWGLRVKESTCSYKFKLCGICEQMMGPLISGYDKQQLWVPCGFPERGGRTPERPGIPQWQTESRKPFQICHHPGQGATYAQSWQVRGDSCETVAVLCLPNRLMRICDEKPQPIPYLPRRARRASGEYGTEPTVPRVVRWHDASVAFLLDMTVRSTAELCPCLRGLQLRRIPTSLLPSPPGPCCHRSPTSPGWKTLHLLAHLSVGNMMRGKTQWTLGSGWSRHCCVLSSERISWRNRCCGRNPGRRKPGSALQSKTSLRIEKKSNPSFADLYTF